MQAGLKPEQMRQQLGRFGLSGHHHLQPICKLSGGQKARVVFTSISLGHPHILLLDEPTNHLDMQSIDALAEALEQVSCHCSKHIVPVKLLSIYQGHKHDTPKLSAYTVVCCAKSVLGNPLAS